MFPRLSAILLLGREIREALNSSAAAADPTEMSPLLCSPLQLLTSSVLDESFMHSPRVYLIGWDWI